MKEKTYNLDGELLNFYVTPEMFGAKADGATNDAAAIQAALDVGGLIMFTPGKTYRVSTTLRVDANTIIDLNGATIASTIKHLMYNFLASDTDYAGYIGNGNITIRNGYITTGSISFAHGMNIRLENVHFSNCINDHYLEIAACQDYTVEGCSFIGMTDDGSSVYEYINIDPCTYSAFPWMSSGDSFYDGVKNDGIKINNCIFAVGTGDYANGYNAIGVHGQAGTGIHQNIRITNCEITGFTGCGIRLNDMQGVFIGHNKIDVVGDGVRVGDVADCEDVTIVDNDITCSAGAEIKVTADACVGIREKDNDFVYPSFSMFQTFGVIGDSFASGEIYVSGSGADYYKQSWGQILARMTGVGCVNYSKGGLTTEEWLSDSYGLTRLNEKTANHLYIIALGINDANQLGVNALGTIADITSDSTASFYSYYGRIVRAIQAHAPNAAIMLSTCARFGGNYDTFSDAIREIGDYYDFGVLDLAESAYFASEFYAGNLSSNHPLAVAYAGMAKEYKRLVELELHKHASRYSTYTG